MLKQLLVACGATLLLAGSGIADTDDVRRGIDVTTDDGATMSDHDATFDDDTDDEALDERGSGDAGLTGSGATGEKVLDPTVPAERMRPGHAYDEQGNPIHVPPIVD